MNLTDSLLLQAFERSEAGIGVVDINGNWIRVNSSLCALTGYTEQELLKTNLYTLLNRADLKLERGGREFPMLQMLKGQSSQVSAERWIYPKEGSPLWGQFTIIPVPAGEGRADRQDYFVIRFEVRQEKRQEPAFMLADNSMDLSSPVNPEKWKRMELIADLIADHCTDLIGILEMDGRMLFASPSHCSVLGDHRYQGRSVLEFVHPDDKPFVIDTFSQIAISKESRKIEFRYIDQQGKIVYIECQGNPALSRDGEVKHIIIIGREITQRKESERRLQESEERYRMLVELSPIPIAILEKGRFTYVNPSGMKLFGADHPDQLLGKACIDFVHPDYRNIVRRRMGAQTAELPSVAAEDQKILTLDGKILDVLATGISLQKDNQIQMLVIIKDVTKQKHMEQELRQNQQLYHELQRSLDRFSGELFRVMKAAELDKRLISEISTMMKVRQIGIMELEHACPAPQLSIEIGQLHLLDDQYVMKLWSSKTHASFLHFKPNSPDNSISKPMQAWLKTLVRYASVLYHNLQTMEDLIQQLKDGSQGHGSVWLLRLLFKLSEKERAALSLDLHDSALQEQIRWYRRLHLLTQPENTALTPEIRSELLEIEEGLLDVIHQIRLTCNELRPPLLLEFGLAESLNQLFEYTQKYADYTVEFKHNPLGSIAFTEEQMISIYRIVQELLANASKHSNASRVQIELDNDGDTIEFKYMDNGKGLNTARIKNSFKSIGLSGICNRVRSLGGQITIHSEMNQGFEVTIRIPSAA
ncbi:PAS domain S-box protein [Paenibacillus pinistramenti]|uniref:sensor histidine kinase n=1 Tax=Paenibacillus pinistramenti TaxID=1768003 RepID=UPI001108746B|nr:PAS domain S-box protein [Paenibacillus pinistramenti]